MFSLPRARVVVIALVAFIHLYAFPYFGALKHANELPRVLTTQQIVRRGTFQLGERMDDLGSRADISTTPDGRRYQNKAPGLSILAVPFYAPLAAGYRIFGGAGSEPSLRVTTWLLRVMCVTIPAILFLAVFRKTARRFAGDGDFATEAATIAYGLGSLALPYALVFMSHVPAAVATGSAFALAMCATRDVATDDARGRRDRRAAIGVGLLLGLAMFIEYQAVFGAAFVSLYALVRARGRRLRWIVMIALGVAPFIAALACYHAACFGSPFRTGYAYSVDPANRVGFWGIVGPSKKGLSQLFMLGNNGLIVLSPWVLLSVVGIVAVARDREKRAQLGAEVVTATCIALTYLSFVASLEPEFGRAGWSVGPRYIAVAMPFFAWLAAAGIAACDDYVELRVPVLATVLAAVLVNVLAASTYPHWPTDFLNPVFEVSLRFLREGRAPHSIGTLFGLRGIASLVPLYVAVAALIAWAMLRAGVRRLHLGIAVVLALVALSRFENFAKTPEPTRSAMWSFISSTYEP